MQCSVWNLRIFSTTVLVAAMAYACDCRGLIIRTWKRDPTVVGSEALKLSQLVSPIALHTAVNVALFPPMFFFSGLYYTDVLSTCVVIRVFRAFLQRKGAYTNSTEGSIWIYLGGIVALTMRQTNIFWVAIFMGGLEAVRTIKMNAKPVDQSPEPQTMQELTISAFNQYIHGNIYDIPLMDAGVHGLLSPPPQELKLTSSRFCTLHYQHRNRRHLSSNSHLDPLMALHRTPHIFRSVCSLERWCCPRRQIKPCRYHSPPTTPLSLAFHSILLLATSPFPRSLLTTICLRNYQLPHHTLTNPQTPNTPKTCVPSSLHGRCPPRNTTRNPLQHHHPPFHPRRQQALCILRLPLHDTPTLPNPLPSCAHLPSLFLPCLPFSCWIISPVILSPELQRAATHFPSPEPTTPHSHPQRRMGGTQHILLPDLDPVNSAITHYCTPRRASIFYSAMGAVASSLAFSLYPILFHLHNAWSRSPTIVI